MNLKGGNFFEEYIEKAVLVIVGLICLWLLVTRVIISPCKVKYDNKKYSAGSVDEYISEQARLLREKLNRAPQPKQPYQRRFGNLMALVDSAITDIDGSLSLPQPGKAMEKGIFRAFRTPTVGGINDVRVGHIRTVAYVPSKEIDEGNFAERELYNPGDIDLVTVEAKFDAAELYKSFYGTFAGEEVRQQWRDPCLAKPVFAAVQLQRQQLLADGTWSGWEIVPRARIEPRKRMFEVIEDVRALPPGGMKVRLLQFNDAQVRAELLQPRAYSIASANDEWFPPSLYEKFLRYQQEVEAQEKRGAMEAQRQERMREKEKKQGSRASKARTRVSGGAEDELGIGIVLGPTATSKRTTSRRTGREPPPDRERPEGIRDATKPATFNVYDEFGAILIDEKTELSKIRQPLTFWAFDDTAEQDKCYRYRIRLGVFNPIAGTDQFEEKYKSWKDKVILWSKFSEATVSVTIPKMLYFFPYDIQQTAKTVTIQVSRYLLGQWYSKDFMVRCGELIGKVAEPEIEREQEKTGEIPAKIDYSTGAILVDALAVSDWSAGKVLRPRHYFDMLYSIDDTSIKRLPIEMRYWPEELQAKYNEIKRSKRETQEAFRAFGGGLLELRRAGQEMFLGDE